MSKMPKTPDAAAEEEDGDADSGMKTRPASKGKNKKSKQG